jgi:hypothetical protein
MHNLSQRVARLRPRRRPDDLLPEQDDAQPAPRHTAGSSNSAAVPDEGTGGISDPELVVSGRRAGMYLVTDGAGREVARIRGDQVVGFTTEYGGRLRWFEDLEEARRAVAADRGHTRTDIA